MSYLVKYALKSGRDHDQQVAAMRDLTNGLRAEAIPGLSYSTFETDDPTTLIGVLEWEDEAAKEGFLSSDSFAAYRKRVTPILTGPPQTTDLTAIASTRD